MVKLTIGFGRRPARRRYAPRRRMKGGFFNPFTALAKGVVRSGRALQNTWRMAPELAAAASPYLSFLSRGSRQAAPLLGAVNPGLGAAAGTVGQAFDEVGRRNDAIAANGLPRPQLPGSAPTRSVTHEPGVSGTRRNAVGSQKGVGALPRRRNGQFAKRGRGFARQRGGFSSTTAGATRTLRGVPPRASRAHLHRLAF